MNEAHEFYFMGCHRTPPLIARFIDQADCSKKWAHTQPRHGAQDSGDTLGEMPRACGRNPGAPRTMGIHSNLRPHSTHTGDKNSIICSVQRYYFVRRGHTVFAAPPNN